MSDIQDGRASRKKAWKAFQANYDDVFALSDRLCSYCLSDQMVQALLTMTEYLKWPTRWVSAAGTIDDEQIQLFASQMEYRLMNGCCDDNLPIQWRYTSDGTLQESMNGGGTWIDAPLYDPRVYSPTFPPAPGADGFDKKCVAAAGMVLLIEEQVGDQLTDDMARYTLGQLITDWVKTMIDTSNPFEVLVTVVTNQIFALVIATLRPALTDDVYKQLQCIFYCRMANDASFNTSQWQQVRSDITSDIAGIAGIFLEHLCYLLGEKGLTNLARSGAATEGDCSDCTDCLTCSQRWHILNDDHANYGTIIAVDETSITVQASFSYESRYDIHVLTGSIDACCKVTAIENLIGGATDQYWEECGSTSVVGGGLQTWDDGICPHYLIGYSASPFTVKITLEDC